MAYLRLAVSLRDDVALVSGRPLARNASRPYSAVTATNKRITPGPLRRVLTMSAHPDPSPTYPPHHPTHPTKQARIINTPRRGLGDTSVEKLQAFAAARGQTLSSLLFGGMGGSGGYAAGGAGAAGAAGEDAAAGALPQLPDRKDLGLTPKASAALQAFRELMAGLHAAVASQPLGRALDTILAKVSVWGVVVGGGSWVGWRPCFLPCLGSLGRRRSPAQPATSGRTLSTSTPTHANPRTPRSSSAPL